MRITVSPEQLKFFRTQGYLELEELITEQEASALLKSIADIHVKSPGYPEENLFRSINQISKLARKKGWGQITSELLHKRPLRIQYDKFFPAKPDGFEPLDDESCGILLNLTNRKALFFKQFPPQESLYKGEESCYFFLILTAKFLPEKMNPLIVS